MPADSLTILTAVVFAAAFLIFVALAMLVLAAIGSERRRWRGRLRRASGHPDRAGADRELAQAQRSVRKSNTLAPKSPLDRLVAALTPGYERLGAKLARSGAGLSATRYVLLTYVLGLGLFGVVFGVFGLAAPIALLVAVGGGMLLPYAFLRYMAYRRTEKFLRQLPEALDLMVRGLKSGLPVMESVESVARDFEDPVRTYFEKVHNTAQLGSSLEDALWEVASELNLPEFNFFAISVSLQRETGGNLTENLTNLSAILRRRHNMKMKVKAMSSEARASAYILTSLPFLVAGAITVINPAYMSTLYQDPRGLVMVAAALVSIGLGVAVMVKMVNFEI